MAEFTLIAEGLCNVEGPTVGPGQWLLNVCSISRPGEPSWPTRGGDITATRLDGGRDVRFFVNTSTESIVGIPAAIAFGPDGDIFVTDEGRRAIVRISSEGVCEDLITSYRGDRINGPNDLSFAPNGDLYFTDPWGSSRARPIGAVYGYSWEQKELTQIDSGMAFPNGIVVGDDSLFVAETLTRSVWVYDIVGSGIATGKSLFCELPEIVDVDVQGPDGMCLDAEGNLYVAHFGSSGVYVYSPNGDHVDTIVVPGTLPTNVCFGGDDGRQLIITVDDTGQMISTPREIPGKVLSFCPSRRNVAEWASALESTEAPDGSRPYRTTE